MGHFNKTKKVERYLSSQVLEDLRLWKDSFLPALSMGMSLNLITYRRPSFLCWSDACPDGMGGFDHLGFAWRFRIPEKFRSRMKNKNNCLEFVASIITIWQSIIQDRTGPEECFLSLGDNSSSVGWLHKASVDPTKNLPLFLASRKFAQIMLTYRACIYSQHISGISNTIADALSRRFDLDDNSLTTLINSQPHLQVQNSFKLCQLNPEISSWMISWMQNCKETKVSQKIPKTRNVGYGGDGQNTHIQLDSPTICGYQTSVQTIESMLSGHSQQPSVEESFLAQTRNAWLRQQSKRPWQNWVRSLGQTWGTTPHMEQAHSNCIPYLPDSLRGCEI
jgi:hypothetical protein